MGDNRGGVLDVVHSLDIIRVVGEHLATADEDRHGGLFLVALLGEVPQSDG